MNNLHDLDELELIIAKIVGEQEKSFETSLNYYQSLSKKKMVEEVYSKSILPVYRVLEILYQEKKIDIDQYNQRLRSLLKLCELLEYDVKETKFIS